MWVPCLTKMVVLSPARGQKRLELKRALLFLVFSQMGVCPELPGVVRFFFPWFAFGTHINFKTQILFSRNLPLVGLHCWMFAALLQGSSAVVSAAHAPQSVMLS